MDIKRYLTIPFLIGVLAGGSLVAVVLAYLQPFFVETHNVISHQAHSTQSDVYPGTANITHDESSEFEKTMTTCHVSINKAIDESVNERGKGHQSLDSDSYQEALLSLINVEELADYGLKLEHIKQFVEEPVTRINNVLKNELDQANGLLNILLESEDGTARDFLISVLAGTSDDTKGQVIDVLFESERNIDHQAAITLITQLDDLTLQKQAFKNNISTDMPKEAMRYMLNSMAIMSFINKDLDVQSALLTVYQNTDDYQLQGLALGIMARDDTVDEEIFYQIIERSHDQVSEQDYSAISALNNWVLEQHVLFSETQLSDITMTASNIANNDSYAIEVRMKALELLKNIQ